MKSSYSSLAITRSTYVEVAVDAAAVDNQEACFLGRGVLPRATHDGECGLATTRVGAWRQRLFPLAVVIVVELFEVIAFGAVERLFDRVGIAGLGDHVGVNLRLLFSQVVIHAIP